MKQDYKSQTKEQLQDKSEELKIRIMQTTRKTISPKEKYEHRSRLRRERARVKTELRRREL